MSVAVDFVFMAAVMFMFAVCAAGMVSVSRRRPVPVRTPRRFLAQVAGPAESRF